jgi:hypothetical protein
MGGRFEWPAGLVPDAASLASFPLTDYAGFPYASVMKVRVFATSR